MTDVIEYVRRSTLNMTNVNTAHKRKGRSRLYHIVENDFATTVKAKWKPSLTSQRSEVGNIKPHLYHIPSIPLSNMHNKMYNCPAELLIASGNKIELFSFHADEFDDEHDEKATDGTSSSVLYHLHQKVFYFLNMRTFV